MRTAQKLHRRLLAFGLDVYEPKRLWLGRGTDNGDWWRWEAGERVSNGRSSIGCSRSIKDCLGMTDAELKHWLDHSSGDPVFRDKVFGFYKPRSAAETAK